MSVSPSARPISPLDTEGRDAAIESFYNDSELLTHHLDDVLAHGTDTPQMSRLIGTVFLEIGDSLSGQTVPFTPGHFKHWIEGFSRLAESHAGTDLKNTFTSFIEEIERVREGMMFTNKIHDSEKQGEPPRTEGPVKRPSVLHKRLTTPKVATNMKSRRKDIPKPLMTPFNEAWHTRKSAKCQVCSKSSKDCYYFLDHIIVNGKRSKCIECRHSKRKCSGPLEGTEARSNDDPRSKFTLDSINLASPTSSPRTRSQHPPPSQVDINVPSGSPQSSPRNQPSKRKAPSVFQSQGRERRSRIDSSGQGSVSSPEPVEPIVPAISPTAHSVQQILPADPLIPNPSSASPSVLPGFIPSPDPNNQLQQLTVVTNLVEGQVPSGSRPLTTKTSRVLSIKEPTAACPLSADLFAEAQQPQVSFSDFLHLLDRACAATDSLQKELPNLEDMFREAATNHRRGHARLQNNIEMTCQTLSAVGGLLSSFLHDCHTAEKAELDVRSEINSINLTLRDVISRREHHLDLERVELETRLRELEKVDMIELEQLRKMEAGFRVYENLE